MGADEVEQAQVVGDFFLPPNENAAVAVEPRCGSLDDPAASAFAVLSLGHDLLTAI